MDITTVIGVGHANAKTLREISEITGISSRKIKKMIADSPELIISMPDGTGYFIPSVEDREYIVKWIMMLGKHVHAMHQRIRYAATWYNYMLEKKGK